MIKKITLSLGAAALLFGSSIAAGAQGIEFGPNGVRIVPPGFEEPRREDLRRDRFVQEISPDEAASIARNVGMQEVDRVVRRQNSYRVTGIDRSGNDLQVTVDRETGDVLGVRRI